MSLSLRLRDIPHSGSFFSLTEKCDGTKNRTVFCCLAGDLWASWGWDVERSLRQSSLHKTLRHIPPSCERHFVIDVSNRKLFAFVFRSEAPGIKNKQNFCICENAVRSKLRYSTGKQSLCFIPLSVRFPMVGGRARSRAVANPFSQASTMKQKNSFLFILNMLYFFMAIKCAEMEEWHKGKQAKICKIIWWLQGAWCSAAAAHQPCTWNR